MYPKSIAMKRFVFTFLIMLPALIAGSGPFEKLPHDDFELVYQDESVTIYHHRDVEERTIIPIERQKELFDEEDWGKWVH